MKRKTPKVSILVPCYNQEHYIMECIDSILIQDFKDYELIISDDGSSDNTQNLLLRYKDERIKLILNEKNQGMVDNWNYILSEANGDYVKFVFGDDKLTSKGSIAEMVRVLDERPDIGFVFCERLLIDSKSQGKKIAETFSKGGSHEGRDIIYKCLSSQKNLVGEPTAVMFRRGLTPRGFDGRLRQLVDLEMWLRMAVGAKAFFIKQPLVAFRIHDAQQTKLNLKVIDLSESEMHFLVKLYSPEETYRSARIFTAFERGLKKKGSGLLRELEDGLQTKTTVFMIKITVARIERAIIRPLQNLKRTLTRGIQSFRINPRLNDVQLRSRAGYQD